VYKYVLGMKRKAKTSESEKYELKTSRKCRNAKIGEYSMQIGG
jgi:hypothetical protein